MGVISDEVRNALWSACQLTNCIVEDKGLLQDDLFPTGAKTFMAGFQDIHAGLVGVSKYGIIVAIKGTDAGQSVLDVINDLFCFALCNLNGGGVHAGFYAAQKALVEVGMLEEIRRLVTCNADKRLYFTGHSKGGAVTTLLATYFHPDPAKVNVVTFAAPHVGDNAFRANYRHAHWRYESFMDLVPHLPPTNQEYTLLGETGALIALLTYILGSVPILNFKPLGELVNFYVDREDCRAYGGKIPKEQHNPEGETLSSLYAVEWMALSRLFKGNNPAGPSGHSSSFNMSGFFDLNGLINLMNDIHNSDYDEMVNGRNTVFY